MYIIYNKHKASVSPGFEQQIVPYLNLAKTVTAAQ
jgi:hypothetical protein